MRYYVIRSGWNPKNQPWQPSNNGARNAFETGFYKLCGIVEAESRLAAVLAVNPEILPGQYAFATDSPDRMRGLRQQAKRFVTE